MIGWFALRKPRPTSTRVQPWDFNSPGSWEGGACGSRSRLSCLPAVSLGLAHERQRIRERHHHCRLRSITAPSAHRRALARRVVEKLAQRTDLRATLLAGSAALGISDEHSDIDLLNFYEVLPDHAAFDAALSEVGAQVKGQISPPGPEGFVARYDIDGVELQTGGELIAFIERRLERIYAGNVDWVDAKAAMGLQEGIAIYGDDLIARWKERAAYPESLRRREVERNLGIFPIWRIDDHLAARDAELFRRQMLVEGAFRVVAVLAAINRMYFSTFQFKRAGAFFEQLAIKPERLAERIDVVANADPSTAADELRRLVDETRSIVKAEMPDMDVDAPWQPPLEK